METMKLMFMGEEQELTNQEVQEKLDELVYENSQLELEKENLKTELGEAKTKLDEAKKSSDLWWNSYKDEQTRNARIRKAVEAAKTVLEMC